jgi:hypothetical protein
MIIAPLCRQGRSVLMTLVLCPPGYCNIKFAAVDKTGDAKGD